MPANMDIGYRIDILRALAYLFEHPEIASGVELEWNAVDPPPGMNLFVFNVDKRIMESTMIRLGKHRRRPVR